MGGVALRKAGTFAGIWLIAAGCAWGQAQEQVPEALVPPQKRKIECCDQNNVPYKVKIE